MQRQQGPICEMVDPDVIGQMFPQMGDIVPFHRAIDDQKQAHGRPRDHQIIQNAACVLQQQGITLPPLGQRCEIRRGQRLQRRIGTIPGDHQLAHMRHIEQTRLRAGPQMFGNNAFKLQGHVIARKGHHPCTTGAMPGIQRESVWRRQICFS